MSKNVVYVYGELHQKHEPLVLRDCKTNHGDECAVGLEIVAEEP
jgi:hypothetical protein